MACSAATISFTELARSRITPADEPAETVESPGTPSQRITLRAFNRDGLLVRVTAPGARSVPGGPIEPEVTAMTYDGRGLPWATTTGTGARVTEFDNNGNLRRTVNPAGVSEASGRVVDPDPGGTVTPTSVATKNATVREYLPNDLLERVHMPWGAANADDQRRFTQDLTYDSRGRVTTISAVHATGAPTLDQTYTYWDSGWIKTSRDAEIRSGGACAYCQTVSYEYDKRGHQTKWISDPGVDAAPGRAMVRTYWPSGQLKTRTAAKLRPRAAAAPPGSVQIDTSRSYRYDYDPNGNLTRLTDPQFTDPAMGAREDPQLRFNYEYDVENRMVRANDVVLGESDQRGRDSTMAYDVNDNLVVRRT